MIIIGNGSYARVVFNTLYDNNFSLIKKVIFVTETDIKEKDIYFREVISLKEAFEDKNLDKENFIVAIGDNKIRKRLYEQAINHGWIPINIRHHFSFVSEINRYIGNGNFFAFGVLIGVETKIGNNCIINTSSTIEHDCIIDNHISIAPGCHLCGNVVVGELTSIGAGTVVIPNIKIGKNCYIHAGSIITKDIPDNFKGFVHPHV